MAIPIYLAMTAGEIRYAEQKPDHMAWMACHFSPYGTGLSNLPDEIPEGSLLILNDRTPIHRHDPDRILDILTERVNLLKAGGVLLDFERAPNAETDKVIQVLTRLPCPLCVSHRHIYQYDLPVFLPPVPVLTSAEDSLQPWKTRRIWLEISRNHTAISVTPNGTQFSDLHPKGEFPFCDSSLHCHYRVELQEEAAVFYLSRTEEDVAALLHTAESCGVEKAVGLWQEMHSDAKTAPEIPERS